jgi:hypothetical protein
VHIAIDSDARTHTQTHTHTHNADLLSLSWDCRPWWGGEWTSVLVGGDCCCLGTCLNSFGGVNMMESLFLACPWGTRFVASYGRDRPSLTQKFLEGPLIQKLGQALSLEGWAWLQFKYWGGCGPSASCPLLLLLLHTRLDAHLCWVFPNLWQWKHLIGLWIYRCTVAISYPA